MARGSTWGVRLGEVGPVNSPPAARALRDLGPDVVIVYGTRIIKRATLLRVPAPFINYHVGMTPSIAGRTAPMGRAASSTSTPGSACTSSMRAWTPAMCSFRPPPEFSRSDNIAKTSVQMATALPLLIRAIEDALAGCLAPRPC
jgi:hypothetical protein